MNILPDGTLDYEDELLARLDWVVASVHTAFGMSEQAMTERMIAAIEHPLVDAIGHPTGRLIERREPYAVDLEAVFAAAARTGTMLEINANPDRRDLSEAHARAAVRAGVRIVIDSDAHRPETLRNMRWGVLTARRGWLTKADVANTRRGRSSQAAAQTGPLLADGSTGEPLGSVDPSRYTGATHCHWQHPSYCVAIPSLGLLHSPYRGRGSAPTSPSSRGQQLLGDDTVHGGGREGLHQLGGTSGVAAPAAHRARARRAAPRSSPTRRGSSARAIGSAT